MPRASDQARPRRDRDSVGEPGQAEVRVRYAETDQMGRAYHAHYVVWCEVARTDLMRGLGTSYGDLEERGIYLPVSDLEISFRRAAEYEDRVRITTEVERVRSRSVTFGYELHRQPEEELLARARTELVCVNADGAPRRLPDRVRQVLREQALESP